MSRPGAADAPASLSEALRHATRDLHAAAERSGIMRAFLRGRIERAAYVALLASLHPMYRALETGLDEHPALPVRFPALYRTAPLAADLDALHGPDWPHAVPVAPSARRITDRLTRLTSEDPHRLAAHAYVRYLGDLSGGAALGTLVRSALNLRNGTGTAFYTFPPPDAAAWKARFRAALDVLGSQESTRAGVLDEACSAFRLHITMFEEIGAIQAGS